MKPPKCRLCEHEHWTNEPHKFKDEPSPVCNHCVTKDEEIARLRNQVKIEQERADMWRKQVEELAAQRVRLRAPKRDRAAYMREYRAKA